MYLFRSCGGQHVCCAIDVVRTKNIVRTLKCPHNSVLTCLTMENFPRTQPLPGHMLQYNAHTHLHILGSNLMFMSVPALWTDIVSASFCHMCSDNCSLKSCLILSCQTTKLSTCTHNTKLYTKLLPGHTQFWDYVLPAAIRIIDWVAAIW